MTPIVGLARACRRVACRRRFARVGQAAGDAAADAAAQKLAEDPESVPSEGTLKAAGGAAAAAACAAAGAPVASPLCAAVGSALVGELIDFVKGLGNAGAIPPAPLQNAGFFVAELHNRLFPREPRWQFWDGMKELEAHDGDGGWTPKIERDGLLIGNELQPWPSVGTGISPEELRFQRLLKPIADDAKAALIARRAAELVDEQSRVEARPLPTPPKKSGGGLGLGLALGAAALALILRGRAA